MDDLTRAARTIALLGRILERAAGDLTLAQYRVLSLVAEGDERASLLAGRLAVTKPSMSAVVDGLVERGYLAREPVEGDRRAIRLRLTADGAAALAAAEAAISERLTPIIGGLSDPAAFLASLDEMSDVMRSHFRAKREQHASQ
jgi:DNA-binding MarR family transcriptional regulator